MWNRLKVDSVTLEEGYKRVYAIKFAPDGSAVSLGVGVYMPNDMVHVEIIERKPMSAGTSWIVNWLFDRKHLRWRKAGKIIIDGASGTQLLVEELVRTDKRISKRILTPNVKEAAAAYSAFQTAIEQRTLTHYNQPALNGSIKTAKKRSIGKDGMYGYASLNPDIQIDPTECAAFCAYGAVRFKNAKTTGGSAQKVMI
jgi:hypothetical protein